MQTYELYVIGRSVGANSDDTTLVRTSVGVDSVHIVFDDSEWLDFPLTTTFSQKGVSPITTSMSVSRISGSPEWSAEATIPIPWEVITTVGPIYITIQGTDANGNHIITAKGAPLTVEEAGDVTMGDIPEDAPTVDQWNQAYSNAMTAINEVQGIIANFQDNVASILADAEAELRQAVDDSYITATRNRLGMVKVGDGLLVDADGALSVESSSGVSSAQAHAIDNFIALASTCFGIDVRVPLAITEQTQALASSVPIDEETLTVNDSGKITISYASADSEAY